ncbi:MAG: ABC transporter permease [Chloroflexi bacterium]|nr:ABC transporter permease [Chloroflexota bacterium]
MISETQVTRDTHYVKSSKSKPISSWKVFAATTVKDLLIQFRYLPNLVGRLFELTIRIGFFYLLASITTYTVAGSVLTGRSLIVFMFGGLLLFVYSNTSFTAPMNAVSNDLHNGTLEYLYSNPSSRYAYFLGNVLSSAIVNQIVFLPLYIVLFFIAEATAFNMLMVLLVCLAVMGVLISIGIMIAMLALIWRQVGAFVQILAILFEFVSGTYFPLSAYPLPLQYLAYALPYTWGYDLIRYYSLQNKWQTILPPWIEWCILGAYAVVFMVISRILLVRAERRSKKLGLHFI